VASFIYSLAIAKQLYDPSITISNLTRIAFTVMNSSSHTISVDTCVGATEGLAEADALALGDVDVLGEIDVLELGEVDALGDTDALAELDVEALGDPEADGERDAEGDVDEDALELGETEDEGE